MSKREDELFIGWARTPKADRRFMLGAGLALLGGGGGAAAWLARGADPVGTGTWNQGAVKDWFGDLVTAPYPMLRLRNTDGTPRTAFLATSGKLGVQARLKGYPDSEVRVRGSLIARGTQAMIAVVDGPDWIAPVVKDPYILDEPSYPPVWPWTEHDQGEALLTGEILDTKCWFGAMRPSSGKVHKACASLCIRGGLPPAFCANGCGEGALAPLLLDEHGQAHGPALLPLVADPVQAQGRLVKVGDVLQFRVALGRIRRL